jgi:hypothetical protein
VGVDSFVLGLGTVNGTYTTAFAACASVLLVFSEQKRQFLLAGLCLAAFAAASLLSLARGPWLAFMGGTAASMGIGYWHARRTLSIRTIILRLLIPFVSIGVVAITIMAVSSTVRGLILARFLALTNLATGSGWGRVQLYQEVIRDAQRSLVFGNGAASYRAVSELLGVRGSVSENFVVEMLHASGIVGVSFLALGLGRIILHGVKRAAPGIPRPIPAALIAGGLTLIGGAMTNPSFWNGLFWMILGIVATVDNERT